MTTKNKRIDGQTAGERAKGTILLATANPGKRDEFRRLIPTDIDLLDLRDVGITMPEETGSSFRAIAEQKALFAARQSNMIALADDSGLEVDALDGAPGIRSARFAGEPPDDARNRRALLTALAEISAPERTARFVCAVTIASPAGIVRTSQGVLRGTILDHERGTRGFGYDSLFLLENGRTVAELLDEEKSAVSHRGQAVRAILPALYEVLETPRADRLVRQ